MNVSRFMNLAAIFSLDLGSQCTKNIFLCVSERAIKLCNVFSSPLAAFSWSRVWPLSKSKPLSTLQGVDSTFTGWCKEVTKFVETF